MNIITISNKMDMCSNFYTKQNMNAVEWKLNAMINKNQNLVKIFNRNWRHFLDSKFESYRV